MSVKRKIVWPDYTDCLVNLANSVLCHFHADYHGKTLPVMDQYLEKGYKNIVILLLDGMGSRIMENHLKEDGILRSHLIKPYHSVFLSTTVAATTSILSGLQPCEHAWLGWDCYYQELDKNVTVFFNTEQGTKEPAADYPVAETLTPYKNILTKIQDAGGNAYICSPFAEPKCLTLEEVCNRIRTLCKEPEQKYIYAYWPEPDGTLHDFGSGSKEVYDELDSLEKKVAALAEELEDTLLVVTADHGHINIEDVYLDDYPQLKECLIRTPSLEPRVLNLFVKEEKKAYFEAEFRRVFGEKFILMPTEEMIEKNLMGDGMHHEKFRSMLGDYIAIATDSMTLFWEKEPLKSAHASITEDEMMIPFIVFEKK